MQFHLIFTFVTSSSYYHFIIYFGSKYLVGERKFLHMYRIEVALRLSGNLWRLERLHLIEAIKKSDTGNIYNRRIKLFRTVLSCSEFYDLESLGLHSDTCNWESILIGNARRNMFPCKHLPFYGLAQTAGFHSLNKCLKRAVTYDISKSSLHIYWFSKALSIVCFTVIKSYGIEIAHEEKLKLNKEI